MKYSSHYPYFDEKSIMLIPPPYLRATGNEIESLAFAVAPSQRLMGMPEYDASGIHAAFQKEG